MSVYTNHYLIIYCIEFLQEKVPKGNSKFFHKIIDFEMKNGVKDKPKFPKPNVIVQKLKGTLVQAGKTYRGVEVQPHRY